MYQYPYQPYQPDPALDYYRQKAAGLQQPNYQQNFQQSNFPQVQPGLISRSVTGIEEARATYVDPLSTGVFTDLGNGKIYVKRIDNNGNASLQTFTLETAVDRPPNYAEQIATLEKRVADLEGKKTEAA